MKTTNQHCRGCGAAIEVKAHGMSFADGGTEEQRNRAWERAQHEWWNAAGDAARICGFDGATPCGRSGGWCAPYYYNAARKGYSDAYSFADTDMAADRDQFDKFAERIDELMRGMPQRFADVLADIIAEDDAEDAEPEAGDSAPHPFQLTAAQWIERARRTLDDRTKKEDDDELIDAHDDLCNALEVMGLQPRADNEQPAPTFAQQCHEFADMLQIRIGRGDVATLGQRCARALMFEAMNAMRIIGDNAEACPEDYGDTQGGAA